MPLDLLYILKRRGVSFKQWCASTGIQTKADLDAAKDALKVAGELFISDEMMALGNELPDTLEAPGTAGMDRPDTFPSPAIPNASEPQETPVPRRKKTAKVSSQSSE